ncbi:alpha/beta hydrolase fold domain-containing protein [Actinomadura viridis]|uniref:alpha/beta hydrolase n=1 Tax=Actinomadura viridis TaxID=58110 RepID=UPI003679772E
MAAPGGALAKAPEPTPTAVPSPPAASPGLPGTPSATGTPMTPGTPDQASPTAAATGTPTGPAQSRAGAPDPVVSTRAVMVTPRPPKVVTYAYGKHPRQRLDAYWRAGTPTRAQAQGQAPRPAVLVLHGGSWLTGDKSSWKYFARRLTAQGYTVFSANYRLATQAAWPAQRDDAVSAVEFIKKNAARWNIDPNRVVAIGSSAGGLLASQLGTYGDGASRVRGVLALSPVNTPYLAYQDGAKADATPGKRYLRRAVVDLVRCVPSESDPACWKRVEDADASSHVSATDAPMLLMHATDELVPPTHSTGLAAALRGVGVPATVKVVPGTMHASELLNDPSVYPAILSWLKARTR